MTEEMIKEIKHIQQCLINVDMEGEDYEEKMDAVHIIGCPHMCYASQRPEAPQGSTRPEEVTGRPIS